MDVNNIVLPSFVLPTGDDFKIFPVAPSVKTIQNITTKPFKALSLHFPQINLFPSQIGKWRGAIIESVGRDLDLFHNHANEGNATLHRPALIQYRCMGDKAVLWGMNEGADALSYWITQAPERIRMDGSLVSLYPVEMRRTNLELSYTHDYHYYRIKDYLVLNPENYQEWLNERRFIARAEIIQSALTGHLLAFCQAANWWLPERLEVDLVEIHKYKRTRYHNTNLLAFEITYRCNLQLPDEIALGKAVSHGFGVQRKAPLF